jgi:putative spermidine/putrescine transport system substrate-binding protein
LKNIAALVIMIIIGVAAFGGGYYYSQSKITPTKSITWAEWGGTYEATVRQIAQMYTQQTGVQVNVLLQTTSGATQAKIDASWPNSGIDIFSSGPSQAYTLCNESHAIALTTTNVPNLSQVPQSLDVMYNGNVCAVAEAPASWDLAWNPNYVHGNLTSFSQLLNPAFKGKVAIADPTQGSGQFLLALAYAMGGNENNMTAAFNFAEKLAASGNIGLVYTSEADFVNALTTGNAWVGFGGAWDIQQAVNEGATLNYTTVVDNEVVTENDVVSVINGPNQGLALQFLNFLISAQVNQLYASGVGYPPANVGATPNPSVAVWYPTTQQYAEYGKSPNPAVVAANINSWVTEWQQKVEPLYSAG